ncbi:unnamed protein product [Lampetra fluviatilis]
MERGEQQQQNPKQILFCKTKEVSLKTRASGLVARSWRREFASTPGWRHGAEEEEEEVVGEWGRSDNAVREHRRRGGGFHSWLMLPTRGRSSGSLPPRSFERRNVNF